MSLLHLEVCDTGHLSVFRNHTLDDVVNLVLLSQILGLSLCFELLAISDLHLNLLLVINTIVDAGSFGLPLDLVLDFFGP